MKFSQTLVNKELVICSKNNIPHIPILTFFNNSIRFKKDSHKHLRLLLGKTVLFIYHLKENISKGNKTIGLIIHLYTYNI